MGSTQNKLLPGNVGVAVTVGWALMLAIIRMSSLRRRNFS
jgi:hypothetical protein